MFCYVDRSLKQVAYIAPKIAGLCSSPGQLISPVHTGDYSRRIRRRRLSSPVWTGLKCEGDDSVVSTAPQHWQLRGDVAELAKGCKRRKVRL